MNWICTAAVAFAAGLLIGLGISIAVGPAYPKLETERNELRAELQNAHSAAAARAADAETLEKEFAKTRECGIQMTEAWMRSQAFIYMIANLGIEEMIKWDDFREKFTAPWYAPEAAFDLLGGRWLADDFFRCGLLTKEELDRVKLAWEKPLHPHDKKMEWRRVETWNFNGSKNTEPFEIKGKSWRISWRSDYAVGIDVYELPYKDRIEEFSGREDSREDSTIMYCGPGNYYLDLTSVDYARVWVEEFVEAEPPKLLDVNRKYLVPATEE